MKPDPRIETIAAKKLTGIRMMMSLSSNKTVELWRSFMPRRKEITNTIGSKFFSMQLYSATYFDCFNADTSFEKWAAVEVTDFVTIPRGMEAFTLPDGLYAVFFYKGDARNASEFFRYIFQTWLPASDYMLSNRPHFELLGEKYKKDDVDSEEEIWVPVERK